MPDIAQLIQQGAVNLWIFIPTAIALGALHGLEPGHSKTMMAAFIVAIRGSVKQAVLLGLAATLSHTASNANWTGTLFHPIRALEFFVSQLAVFGPLLFVAWLRIVEHSSWKTVVLLVIGGTTCLYLFTSLLSISLPAGILI